MVSFLASLAALLLFAISLWGWGKMAAHWFFGSVSGMWFFPVTLGLAVVGLLGGVGNAIGVAYPVYLWTLLGVGWALAVYAIRNVRMAKADVPWLIVLGGISLLVLTFLAFTLMPSYVLNFHDDLHTYLARPVRMLQTGTLASGWFDLLGLDSLGAQAFFQGFFLLRFPLEYINGFDGVFCTALAVAMSGELARRLGVHLLFAVAAIATLILINPQTVNVSTLFAGVVCIQGLLVSVLLWSDEMEADSDHVPYRPAFAVGLFLGTLIALKVTLVIFAATFFVLWLGSSLLRYSKKRIVALSALFVALSAAVTVIPWVLLHRENLFTALFRLLSGAAGEPDQGNVPRAGMQALFSNHESFYGGGYLDYAALVAYLALSGLVAMFFILSWRKKKSGITSLVAIFSASFATVATYLILPWFTDTETAIRYSSPVLLATTPFAVAASGLCFRKAEGLDWKPAGLSIPGIMLGFAFIFTTAILFGDVLQQRLIRLSEKRTLVSFPTNASYIKYSTEALSTKAQETIRKAQAMTETGTGVLAWISQPYHLDFSRNQVMAASEPALLVPWLELPLDSDIATLRAYLLDNGVRYIIWEKAGQGVRNPREYLAFLRSPDPVYRRLARKNLAFLRLLRMLDQRSLVIYKNRGLIVMDLEYDSKKRVKG